MALVDPDPTRRALGFDPAALSVSALIEAGYTALADDGFGGTELELRDSRGELIDHPDGTPAKVAFDDNGVIATAHRPPTPTAAGLSASFHSDGSIAAIHHLRLDPDGEVVVSEGPSGEPASTMWGTDGSLILTEHVDDAAGPDDLPPTGWA